jgi:hypothetical protein
MEIPKKLKQRFSRHCPQLWRIQNQRFLPLLYESENWPVLHLYG